MPPVRYNSRMGMPHADYLCKHCGALCSPEIASNRPAELLRGSCALMVERQRLCAEAERLLEEYHAECH